MPRFPGEKGGIGVGPTKKGKRTKIMVLFVIGVGGTVVKLEGSRTNVSAGHYGKERGGDVAVRLASDFLQEAGFHEVDDEIRRQEETGFELFRNGVITGEGAFARQRVEHEKARK